MLVGIDILLKLRSLSVTINSFYTTCRRHDSFQRQNSEISTKQRKCFNGKNTNGTFVSSNIIRINACTNCKQEKLNAHSNVPFLSRAQCKHHRRKHFTSLSASQFIRNRIYNSMASEVQKIKISKNEDGEKLFGKNMYCIRGLDKGEAGNKPDGKGKEIRG